MTCSLDAKLVRIVPVSNLGYLNQLVKKYGKDTSIVEIYKREKEIAK